MKIAIPISMLLCVFVCYSCVSDHRQSEMKTEPGLPERHTNELPGDKMQEDEYKMGNQILALDDFHTIPDDIEGCSCIFSASQEKFKNGTYLFAAGFDSIAYVMVENKLLKLKFISTERESHTSGDYDHRDVYGSGIYKVTVDTRCVKTTGEEAWWNEGTITIEEAGGRSAVKTFEGECGC